MTKIQLEEDLELAHARLEAVEETLWNVGACILDDNGYRLNANGMLVDWLDGRRREGWLGTEGRLIDGLRTRLEQASSTHHGIPHTDVPVKDDTK